MKHEIDAIERSNMDDKRRLKIYISDDLSNETLAVLTVHTDEYGNLAINEAEGKGFDVMDIDSWKDEKGEYEEAKVKLFVASRIMLKPYNEIK